MSIVVKRYVLCISNNLKYKRVPTHLRKTKMSTVLKQYNFPKIIVIVRKDGLTLQLYNLYSNSKANSKKIMIRCEYFKYLNIEIEIEILKTNYFKKHFDDFTKYVIQISWK